MVGYYLLKYMDRAFQSTSAREIFQSVISIQPYKAGRTGLGGGWKGFAVAHELVDGDALVFQLVRPTAFKVIHQL